MQILQKIGRLVTVRNVIIAVLLIGLAVFFFFRNKKTVEIKTSKVERSNVVAVVSASGELNGEALSVMKFAGSGKLVSLNKSTGDKVNKGEVVASLDRTSLSSDLQQANNTLRQREAEVQKILDDVKGHDSDETYAQKVTRTEAEVAKDNAYEAVLKAKKAMRDAVLVAPITGVVTFQSDIVVGQNVTSADTVAQITDFSKLYFTGDVDESDISKIALGQKVKITLNAYEGKEFNGRVSEIYPSAETSSSGATTVKVKVEIIDTGISPILGLEGSADIVVSEADNVLSIPNEAVTGEKYVYVKSGMGYEKKEVELGIISDTRSEVKSGLSETDEVVVNPEALPKDNAK